MTVGLCTGPLGPVEDVRQAPMEGVGAHLQGGETTGDKMIAFQSRFVWEKKWKQPNQETFLVSNVKNQWRSEHPNKPAITLYPIVTCRSFWSYLALVIRGPLPRSKLWLLMIFWIEFNLSKLQ